MHDDETFYTLLYDKHDNFNLPIVNFRHADLVHKFYISMSHMINGLNHDGCHIYGAGNVRYFRNT